MSFVTEVQRINAEYDAALQAAYGKYDRKSEARQSVSNLRVDGGKEILALAEQYGVGQDDLKSEGSLLDLGIGNGFVYKPGSYDASTSGSGVGTMSLSKDTDSDVFSEIFLPVAASILTAGTAGAITGAQGAPNLVGAAKTALDAANDAKDPNDVEDLARKALEAGASIDDIRKILSPDVFDRIFGNVQTGTPGGDVPYGSEFDPIFDPFPAAEDTAAALPPVGTIPPKEAAGTDVYSKILQGINDMIDVGLGLPQGTTSGTSGATTDNPGGLPGGTPPFFPGSTGGGGTAGTGGGSTGGGGSTTGTGWPSTGDLIDFGTGSILDIINGNNKDKAINKAADATRQRPYNMEFPGMGSTQWDGQNASFNIDPRQQGLIDSSLAGAQSTLDNPNVNQIVGDTQRVTNENLIPAYNDVMNSESFLPARDRFNDQMGTTFDSLTGSGNEQRQYGRNLLNDTNFDQLAEDRLDIFRDQARPYEQQQNSDLEQSLFNRGTGTSKGGSQDRGALSLTQTTRDQQNMLDSQTFAEKMRQFNIGAGTNLFGQGDQATNMAGGVADSQNRGNILANTAENSRGKDRLAATQDLFKFGAGAKNDQLTTAGNQYDMYQKIFGNINTAYNTSARPGSVDNARSQTGITGGGEAAFLEQLKQLFGI